MKKLKITGKLVMMVLPSMLVLFVVIVFSVFNNLNVYNRTYENIYDQLYVNTELLLNADRDLYQALLAEQELYVQQVKEFVYKYAYEVSIQLGKFVFCKAKLGSDAPM
ncbi:MAG TPA: hypothetical protein PLS36_00080, partial [Clostridia bacterium]|nr:hypothetical protein [Clostridia bacterium]